MSLPKIKIKFMLKKYLQKRYKIFNNFYSKIYSIKFNIIYLEILLMESLLIARLPEAYVIFSPIVDVFPIIPVFFLLLAFVWQAAIGFR